MSTHDVKFLLDAPSAQAIDELVEAARSTDGTPALNEAARLAIGQTGPDQQVAAWRADQLVGYALMIDDQVQLVVDPDHRRRGIATGLLRHLRQEPTALSYWAFGDLPPAHAWAHARQATPLRQLLIMGRDLDDDLPQVPPPEGVRLRTYRPSDAAELIAVNGRAFAHHPEQGAMDAVDLGTRMAEDWYDSNDLLVATGETDAGSSLIGFHWTKQHDAELGEVYVLAVDPAVNGAGIGRALLTAGLRHLRDLGKRRVILYVEADQPRVVDIYRRAGFEVVHTDIVYGFGRADSTRV